MPLITDLMLATALVTALRNRAGVPVAIRSWEDYLGRQPKYVWSSVIDRGLPSDDVAAIRHHRQEEPPPATRPAQAPGSHFLGVEAQN